MGTDLPLDMPSGLPDGLYLGRIANRDKALQLYGEDFVRRMTNHCLTADELGYRVLLDFFKPEINCSWRALDKALEHGIDSIDNPAPSLVELFKELDHVPDWVDFDQLYRGAVAYWRPGKLVPMALSWAAVGAGFSMYSSTRPVLFSNRLSDPTAAGPRLNESFRQIVAAFTPGGMQRFEEGFRLTVKTRLIHAMVRRTLSKHEAWDWPAWGIPINNLDCMNTQAGQFCVEVIDSLRRSGVKISSREEDDIFALSRYQAYVIGVHEDVRHSSTEDGRTKRKFHKLVEQPPDDYCRSVIHAIIDFSTKIPEDGYDPLPGPVAKFMTHERRKKLAYGMLAAWQPDYIDGLHVERTPWRFIIPCAKPFIWLYERLTRMSPDPQGDERKTWAVIEEFRRALKLPPDRKHEELANPETLAADIAANKGKVRRSRKSDTGHV